MSATNPTPYINRRAVRKAALEYANQGGFWTPKRVSKTFLEAIQIETSRAIKARIHNQEHKGSTLL